MKRRERERGKMRRRGKRRKNWREENFKTERRKSGKRKIEKRNGAKIISDERISDKRKSDERKTHWREKIGMEDPEVKEDDENETLGGGQDTFSHSDLVKSIPTLIYWPSGREGGGRWCKNKRAGAK
jgi:hypothetical protein